MKNRRDNGKNSLNEIQRVQDELGYFFPKNYIDLIKNHDAKSKFNDDQLDQLRLGKKQIDGYTWHHNPQSSPNTMQLVPDEFHSNKAVPHTGQNSLKNGK